MVKKIVGAVLALLILLYIGSVLGETSRLHAAKSQQRYEIEDANRIWRLVDNEFRVVCYTRAGYEGVACVPFTERRRILID